MQIKHHVPKLAASGVWYSSGSAYKWIDTFNAEDPLLQVTARIFADQAGSLLFEESNDGATPTTTVTVDITANTPAVLPWTLFTMRWYRLKYTNGGTANNEAPLIFEATRKVSQGALMNDALAVTNLP